MDLEEALAAVLDRRLSLTSPRPVAVALSGGGDSVALLLAAHGWALARGRPLVVLTVDHQLQPQSRAWTEWCANLARSLGVPFQALSWAGAKPVRGLPAAARSARHRLLAEAARSCGARVILMGHTADDVLEARAMRAAGATTPEPREWSPSPAWPEGRGIFLLRPMLGLRRASLRDWLWMRGASWIEDPANADPRYARARARAALIHHGEVVLAEEVPLGLAKACEADAAAGLVVSRRAFAEAPLAEARRLLAIACVCAGGGARLPAAAARDRLAGRLRTEAPVIATLAGARIEADGAEVRIVREAGEARRGGLRPLALPAGQAVAWDGRFELTACAPGLEVHALGGLARRLPPDQQRALATLPAAARAGLPAVVDPSGGVSSPLLGVSEVAVAALAGERLRAAAGLVGREPD